MNVRFQQVSKYYGDVAAVEGLNLTIKKGAFHFLLGPSGCGKTTSLRMLAGLESVSKGKIFFDERDVTHMPAAERGIGMVFQNYALWPHMSVAENISYGLKLRKLPGATLRQRLAEVLQLTQLEAFAKRLPGQLSGGQQQRVALARALAIRPAVLLLDEPLSNLDAKLRLEMRDNLARIHRETQITTLYVTHDQKEALSLGSEITVMRGGRAIQTGSPRELYRQPQSAFLASFMGETNLVAGAFLGFEGQQALVDTPLGRLKGGQVQGHFHAGQEVLLSIRPEAISLGLGQEEKSLENPFEATLQHLTYLGDCEQWEFSYGEKQSLKVNRSADYDTPLSLGAKTRCYVSPRQVVVLPIESV